MEEDTFQSAVNTTLETKKEIFRLRTKANDFLLEDNYSKAFRCLKTIRATIVGILTEVEKKRLMNIEMEFLKADTIVNSTHLQNRTNPAFVNLKIQSIGHFLAYNDSLMQAVQDHDLGIGNKE